jgi:hypothetical protein
LEAEFMTYRTKGLALLAALVLRALPSAAQFTSASLNGLVKDTSGSFVAGATATVVNTDTGFTKTDTTDTGGAFLFPALPIVAYRLTVEKPGSQHTSSKASPSPSIKRLARP